MYTCIYCTCTCISMITFYTDEIHVTIHVQIYKCILTYNYLAYTYVHVCLVFDVHMKDYSLPHTCTCTCT